MLPAYVRPRYLLFKLYIDADKGDEAVNTAIDNVASPYPVLHRRAGRTLLVLVRCGFLRRSAFLHSRHHLRDAGIDEEDRMTPMARYFARKTWQTCREDTKKCQKFHADCSIDKGITIKILAYFDNLTYQICNIIWGNSL